MLRQRVKILLRPGVGLKRWSLLLLLGLALFGLGIGFGMGAPVSPRVMPVLKALTLSGLPPLVRGGVFVLLGSVLGGLALFQTYRVLAAGAIRGRGRVDVLTALDQKRRQGQGPRIVTIGGGTGLSTLLRGLKHETGNLTAIVTISDDGGSSGRLRGDLRMPPPGDARNCLVALSENEPLLEELFNYRFAGGSSLDGHSLGNLLLAALYEMRSGFHESLQAAAQLLALSGRVVPVASNTNLVLRGETVSGDILTGESEVGHAPNPLRRVWIEPEGVVASEVALEAIRDAELIVIGPGSLYTSIIPNFLLCGVREAVAASPVPKVFVCNVATEPQQTDGYGVTAHLKVFQQHTGVAVTHVLANSNLESLPAAWGQAAVHPEPRIDGFEGTLILADVVNTESRTRHDPYKLATALMSIPTRRSKTVSTRTT